MKITISGKPGSGKSTVGRLVAKRLGLKFYSMGDIRGKWALERGMTIQELNRLGQDEEWVDRDTDEFQKKIGKTEDGFVMDSRLGFFFIPDAIKVFLNVDDHEAAERIFRDQESRNDEKRLDSTEEILRRNIGRMQEDRKHHEKLYNVDNLDPDNYDLFIDTTDLDIDEVVERILEYVNVQRHTH